jgi:hypothetical protein
MCELCNIEKGTKELLMESDLHASVSGMDFEHGVIATSVCRDEDGYYMIRSEYITVDGKRGAEHNIHLDFCPWCGQELKHKIKRKLGK